MDVVVCQPAVLCGQQCPANPMHAPSPLFVSISASYSLLCLHPDRLRHPFSHPRGYSFLTISRLPPPPRRRREGASPASLLTLAPTALAGGQMLLAEAWEELAVVAEEKNLAGR